MRHYGHSMSSFTPPDEPLGTFLGGFTYHLRWASSQARMIRLDVFADRVSVRPLSRRRGTFAPTWEARYSELQPVRVVRRPLLLGIRFRRSDRDAFTFRPAGEFLKDGAEPVLGALRSAGAEIE